MAAGNYTIFKATDVKSFKFGDTAWSSADFLSTSLALDTTFATNNASPLFDGVGARDANNPVKSDAFISEIRFSGNERAVEDEDLLGNDLTGAQNKEVVGGAVSKLRIELSLVYRNNVPMSIFNDTTKCVLFELDNDETTTTGLVNTAFNNITMVNVGQLERTPNGSMKQKIIFDVKGGLTGSVISVTQTTAAETWSKVVGGDYAEEVRLT